MNEFYKVLGFGLAVSALLVIVAPLTALFGAFAGWTVSLFWGDAILVTLRKSVGLDPSITMWQLGAALGFVGSFLRTKVWNNENK